MRVVISSRIEARGRLRWCHFFIGRTCWIEHFYTVRKTLVDFSQEVDDVEEEIKAAAVIFRSIITRHVSCASVCDGQQQQQQQTFPPNGETWRGGGFRREFQAFYKRIQGQKYRIPGFLATSSKKSVAAEYALKAAATKQCVMWRVVFDPRGELQPEFRVTHVVCVRKTRLHELEYLFPPYSVFTVVSVNWSIVTDDPHEITIRAANDSNEEPENLPLAPWY